MDKFQNKVISFIENYHDENGIKLCCISQNNDVFEIRICYPEESYERSGGNFDAIKYAVDGSCHAAVVDDDWGLFHHGIIRISVNPASPAYDSTKIVKMMEVVLYKLFPSFKI